MMNTNRRCVTCNALLSWNEMVCPFCNSSVPIAHVQTDAPKDTHEHQIEDENRDFIDNGLAESADPGAAGYPVIERSPLIAVTSSVPNPSETSPVPVGHLPLGQIAFSFRGRISRVTYWLALVFWYVIFVVVNFPITERMFFPDIIANVAVFCRLLLVWVLFAVQVKRWHDLGVTGWAALVTLVLIYVAVLQNSVWWGLTILVIIVALGIMPGKPDANQYGANPLSASMKDKHDLQQARPENTEAPTDTFASDRLAEFAATFAVRLEKVPSNEGTRQPKQFLLDCLAALAVLKVKGDFEGATLVVDNMHGAVHELREAVGIHDDIQSDNLSESTQAWLNVTDAYNDLKEFLAETMVARPGSKEASTCSERVPWWSQFWRKCGAPVQAIGIRMKCGLCSERIPWRSRFCLKCGAPVQANRFRRNIGLVAGLTLGLGCLVGYLMYLLTDISIVPGDKVTFQMADGRTFRLEYEPELNNLFSGHIVNESDSPMTVSLEDVTLVNDKGDTTEFLFIQKPAALEGLGVTGHGEYVGPGIHEVRHGTTIVVSDEKHVFQIGANDTTSIDYMNGLQLGGHKVRIIGDLRLVGIQHAH